MKRTAKIITRIFGWLTLIVLGLFLLVYLFIQVPAVQNMAKNKVISFLQQKLQTKVVVGKLAIDFPNKIVLENVLFEDQRKVTLFSGKKLAVDISLFKLLNNRLEINDIHLENITANIYRRQSDSTFNFQYIIDAFASPAAQKDTASSVMAITLDKIELSNVGGRFLDDHTGNDLNFNVKRLTSRITTFLPDSSQYGIPLLHVEGLTGSMRQYKPLVKQELPMAVVQQKTAEPPAIKLDLGTIDLNQIRFQYSNEISAVKTDFNIGSLLGEVRSINLQQMFVELEELSLKNSSNVVLLGKSEEAKKVTRQAKKEVKATVDNPWKIIIHTADLADNNFRFDDDNLPEQRIGVDYAHLDIKDLTLKANNLQFTPAALSGSIDQFTLKEQRSKFHLVKLTTDFLYNEKEASLTNLYLQTDKTLLRDQLVLNYPSIDALQKNIGLLKIKATFRETKIAVKDIISFAPQLAATTSFKQNASAVFYLNTHIDGYVNNLTIPYLQFKGFSGTSVNATLTVKGLPDAQRAVYNVDIKQLVTNKKDVTALLPPAALPSNIRIPEKFSLSARFNGSVPAYQTTFNLVTDKGNVNGFARVTNTGKTYNVRANVDHLDVGYITKNNPSIGKISANITARGAGFDVKTANALIDANIRSANINGYTYKNVNADIELKRGIADVDAVSADPNVALTLNAKLNLASNNPSVNAVINAENVNLYALKLMNEPLSVKGNITADFPVADINNLNGSLNLNNLLVNYQQQNFRIDSVQVNAVAANGRNTLTVNSPFLTAKLDGVYRLAEIVPALQQTINRYYQLPGFKPSVYQPQNWTLNANFQPQPWIFQFAPQLKGTDSLLLNASFNSAANDLNVVAKSSKIVFNNQRIDSLNFNLTTQQDRLAFHATARSINTPQLKLFATNVDGSVVNNTLQVNASVKDRQGKLQYQLAATGKQFGDGLVATLVPGNLILNYDQWTVAGDNFIEYTSKGLRVNNLNIALGNQSLTVQSVPLQVNAPLNIGFSNFQIKTIARLANQDTLLADGLINGNAVVKDVMNKPVFTSKLNIDHLILRQDTVGNVVMNIDNQTEDILNANIAVTGKNEFTVAGKYMVGSETVDMRLDMQKLDLSLLKSLGAGNVDDAGGFMTGTASINGTLKAPEVNGNFKFKDAYIAPAILGERFYFPAEGFNVTPEGIHFKQFTLKDSLGNTAVIEGYVFSSDFVNYDFDLSVNTNNFRVVNARKGPNKMFYGTLTVDSEIDVTGSMESPVIDGYVMVNKATDFSYILPVNNPEIQAREGVVNFVDIDSLSKDTIQLKPNEDSISRYADLKGLDVYLDVETDTSAQLSVIIDDRNGDALRMRGKGDVAMAIDKSGKLSMTGTYELNSGSYDISLNLLRRHFDIVPGSQITWTGDPTTGILNINAVYVANVPALDLVQPQLVGRAPAEINRFKQRLPFNVKLNLTGELLKPIIVFDIDLPEKQAGEWQEVEQKLTDIRRDQAELNKQVFALLLLNRFVGENPFQSASGGDNNAVQSFVRQSVSRLLSEQLNRLAAGLIQGVDINVGVVSYEDYSTGEHQNRSDVTLNVSKRLLNDRLRVSVGSSFQVEGSSNTNQRRNNTLSDVSLDYQLSSDGRYVLRAYRRNDYEAVVEGQVIETGVSFIFTLDFDSFSDMLRKKSEADLKRRNRTKNVRTDAN